MLVRVAPLDRADRGRRTARSGASLLSREEACELDSWPAAEPTTTARHAAKRQHVATLTLSRKRTHGTACCLPTITLNPLPEVTNATTCSFLRQMLLSSLALAAVPFLASVAQAAPAAGVVLKREALVQSIEADLRARGWTNDRVNDLSVEALKADILALAAEKRLFGWGEDDSSDEGYAPVKTTCEPNTVFVRAADSYVPAR